MMLGQLPPVHVLPGRIHRRMDHAVAPLTEGLPGTPRSRVHSLWLYVLYQGLRDCDLEWLNSRDYMIVAAFANLDLNVAARIRSIYLARYQDGDFFRYLTFAFSGGGGEEKH